MGHSGHYLLSFRPYVVAGCVGTGYVLKVELPVQRRLCPIFVRDVGSPDIHECFYGLTSSQWTPGIWGVIINIIYIKNFANTFVYMSYYMFNS